ADRGGYARRALPRAPRAWALLVDGARGRHRRGNARLGVRMALSRASGLARHEGDRLPRRGASHELGTATKPRRRSSGGVRVSGPRGAVAHVITKRSVSAW